MEIDRREYTITIYTIIRSVIFFSSPAKIGRNTNEIQIITPLRQTATIQCGTVEFLNGNYCNNYLLRSWESKLIYLFN